MLKTFYHGSDQAVYVFTLHTEPDNSEVGTLILIGANGGSCVWLSVREALLQQCSVFTYSKGIIDFNYKDFIYPYFINFKISEQLKNCETCKLRDFSSLKEISLAIQDPDYKVRHNDRLGGTRQIKEAGGAR